MAAESLPRDVEVTGISEKTTKHWRLKNNWGEGKLREIINKNWDNWFFYTNDIRLLCSCTGLIILNASYWQCRIKLKLDSLHPSWKQNTPVYQSCKACDKLSFFYCVKHSQFSAGSPWLGIRQGGKLFQGQIATCIQSQW